MSNSKYPPPMSISLDLTVVIFIFVFYLPIYHQLFKAPVFIRFCEVVVDWW